MNFLNKSLKNFNLHSFTFFNFAKKLPYTAKKVMQYQYSVQDFNPQSSKYSLQNEKIRREQPSNIPNFMKERTKQFRLDLNKKPMTSGKKLNMKKKTFQRRLPKEERQKLKIERIKQQRLKELTEKHRLDPVERKLLGSSTELTRFSPEVAKRQRTELKKELNEKFDLIKDERKKYYNVDTIKEFQDTERLSKRLARFGVTSRRQAEKIIKKGLVKVNGEICDENILIDETYHIQVLAQTNINEPLAPGNTKLYLLHKPRGYLCSYKDENKRVTIYDYLKMKGFSNYNQLMLVGKLDYNSEGLIILTNNGDIARALENNQNFDRCYKVRVFGRMFTDSKLNQIRKGVNINLRKISFWAEIIRKQNTNTWVHIKSKNNSINDIRLLFRRLSLRVNRLVRTDYGPFTLGKTPLPGDIVETPIPKGMNSYLLKRIKEKTQIALRKLDDTKLLQVQNEVVLQQKSRLEYMKKLKQMKLKQNEDKQRELL